jgi:hypothetical protein
MEKQEKEDGLSVSRCFEQITCGWGKIWAVLVGD